MEDEDDDEGIAPRSIEDILRDVPLWRRRLDTWSGRLRGDDQPVTFYFGTSAHGTIYLKPSYPAGILHCAIFLDDRYVATLDHPWFAAGQVGSGRLDKELGFSAKDAHVPVEIEHWAATPMRSSE